MGWGFAVRDVFGGRIVSLPFHASAAQWYWGWLSTAIPINRHSERSEESV